ncbi:MAG: hypothetical protein VXW65_05565 [Pseudomonadota bacterium]|nr:hypothetical protein [Pseudomonadota bacterium]
MTHEQAINPQNTALLWTHNIDSDRIYPLKEAIEIYITECKDNDESPLDVVQIHAFKKKEMSVDWFVEDAIENLMMRLDEEYGNYDDPTEITQKMKDAASVFVKAVVADYDIWQHEPIGSVEIKVSDYWSES